MLNDGGVKCFCYLHMWEICCQASCDQILGQRKVYFTHKKVLNILSEFLLEILHNYNLACLK